MQQKKNNMAENTYIPRVTVEVWEWISNFIPHYTLCMITYLKQELKLYQVSILSLAEQSNSINRAVGE